MGKNPFRSLLATVILLIAACVQAFAADIRPSSHGLCAFTLEGIIAPGDRDRFATLLSHSRMDEYDERTFTICLKSPGGSYVEALKIAELMYDQGISTFIEYGSECFSACAL